MPAELFAICLEGEVLEASVWKKYSASYGGAGLYGWRAPKKIYYKLGHAKNALNHLPQQIQDLVEIVRFVPAETVYKPVPGAAAQRRAENARKERERQEKAVRDRGLKQLRELQKKYPEE